MTKLFKITDENNYTAEGNNILMHWGSGVSHTAPDAPRNQIRAYEHPLLATLFDPLCENSAKPHLWIATGSGITRENQLQSKCKKLKTLRRFELPIISVAARAQFTILCTKVICAGDWNAWAANWLRGKTTEEIAKAARSAAETVLQRAIEVPDLLILLEQAILDETKNVTSIAKFHGIREE